MSPMRLKIVMNRLSMPYSYNNLKKKKPKQENYLIEIAYKLYNDIQ